MHNELTSRHEPRQGRPGLRFGIAAAWLGLLLGASAACAQVAPGSDWWSAIDRDDVSDVTSLLLRNVDPSAFNNLGNPALTQAARDRSWKVFDTLSTTPGVQIDEPNAHGETALMYLCIEGQTARAKKLIAAGAKVNRLGWTPLHYAASKGRVDTAKMLLAHQAIVNAPGPDGTTPLMMAALSGSRPMVDLLLANGADPTMFNLAHNTAASFARNHKYAALAEYLDDAAAKQAAKRQEGAGSSGTSAGGTVPAAAAAPVPAPGAPVSPQPDAAPAQGKSPQPAPGASGNEDKSSFSRYFDLNQ